MFPRNKLKSTMLRQAEYTVLPSAVVLPVGNVRPSVTPDTKLMEVAEVPTGKRIGYEAEPSVLSPRESDTAVGEEGVGAVVPDDAACGSDRSSKSFS